MLLAMAAALVALAGALLQNTLALRAMQGPLLCSAGRERPISMSKRACSLSLTCRFPLKDSRQAGLTLSSADNAGFHTPQIRGELGRRAGSPSLSSSAQSATPLT